MEDERNMNYVQLMSITLHPKFIKYLFPQDVIISFGNVMINF